MAVPLPLAAEPLFMPISPQHPLVSVPYELTSKWPGRLLAFKTSAAKSFAKCDA